MLFAVEVTSTEGETILRLRGELDLSMRPRFMAALAGLDDGVAHVVLDLSELTFLDCSNVGIIKRVRTLAGLRGTHMELRSPNADILRIMELTGLSPATDEDEGRPIVAAEPSSAYAHAGGG